LLRIWLVRCSLGIMLKMIDKNGKPTKLVWLDLEMTGLDPQKDVILEVAAEITDFDFKTLATYEACIKQPKEVVVKRMQENIWWRDYPANRDHFVDNLQDGKDLVEAERELVALIEAQFG